MPLEPTAQTFVGDVAATLWRTASEGLWLIRGCQACIPMERQSLGVRAVPSVHRPCGPTRVPQRCR